MAKARLEKGKPEPKEASTEEKKWQEFKILKKFPTSAKIYMPGDKFKHHDQRVINFLKTHKII